MTGNVQARVGTGVATLDDVLHGGLLPHRLYLLDGNPGAGKTTLALQFLLEGRRLGERVMYVTLSETADELRAGAASHDWSLDGMEIVEVSGGDLQVLEGEELTMFHPSEVELSETTQRVLKAVEASSPSRLVFDSLSEMRLLSQGSLRYRRQILALKQFFAPRDCTVLLLDDRTADGADLQLQSIAHGVISLEHSAPIYGRALRQLRVVKFRGSDFRSGFHDMRLTRQGVEVYPRLAASEHRTEFTTQAIKSGVEALDNLLGGGVDMGTSTLVIGPAGAGKSTITLQYVNAAIARGDHAVIFTFDESRATLLSRATSLGLKLRVGNGGGEVNVTQVDPAEVTPGQFSNMVRHAVEIEQAKVVVIDSLNGYVNAMVDAQYLTAQLHELLSFLANHGVSSFLVAAQSGMLVGQMGTPGDASYLADTVIYMRFYEYAGKVKKAISVLKKRTGPHEDTIREVRFDAAGVHLSEPLKEFRGVLSGLPVPVSEAAGAIQPSI